MEAVGGRSVLLGIPRSLDGRSGDPGEPGCDGMEQFTGKRETQR